MTRIILNNGKYKKSIKVKINETILDIARNGNFELEGSCEGSLACSTCHIIVSNAWYKKLDKPTMEESELLEILPNYTRNSRLGCQIKITKKLDGIEISLPKDL